MTIDHAKPTPVQPQSQHTPGPWRWSVNKQSKRAYLIGGRWLTVMDFVRWGMGGAAPRFRDSENLLFGCDSFAAPLPGQEHNAKFEQTIDHPDARLIAAAPTLLEVLKTVLAQHKDCECQACCSAQCAVKLLEKAK